MHQARGIFHGRARGFPPADAHRTNFSWNAPFFTQLKALGIVVAYSFAVSYGIFKFINFILPLRVTSEEEELGLDESQHNEKYMQGTLLVRNNGIIEEEQLSEI